jgi:hypothetical protein
MQKKTKNFVRDQLTLGIGLGMGANVMGKLGKSTQMAGKISETGMGALGLASTAMTIGGAKYAMDSVSMLDDRKKPKKRKKR